ncbi:MAG: hypothetical protein Q9207_003735 [Kuettlingeria erythrocarpa]
MALPALVRCTQVFLLSGSTFREFGIKMHIQKIAIVGGKGRVGSAIIQELHDDEHFKQLTAILRDTSTSNGELPVTATVVANFSSHASLVAALSGHDAVLSCVPGGATDFESQKLLIDAAVAAGVKLFFASEYSANVMSWQYALLPTQFVGDKPRIRRYLEGKSQEGLIAWTALNGGPFFDLWLTAGPAGFDIANRKATIYGTGNNLACWTPLPTIAKAVRNMLLPATLPKVLNRAVFICGVNDVTQNNILTALEAETGSKFEVIHADVKKIRREAMEALEKDDWKAATRGMTITHQFDEEDSAANFWDLVDNETVGVTPVTVRKAVRATLEVGRKGHDLTWASPREGSTSLTPDSLLR